MKTNLIVGATGFIGSNLLMKLYEDKNNYIVATGRNLDKINNLKQIYTKNITFLNIDFDDNIFQLNEYLKNYDIDNAFILSWNGGFTSATKDYNLQLKNSKICCDVVSELIKLKVKKIIYAGTVNEIEIKQFLNDPSFVPRLNCIYAAIKASTDMILKTLCYNNNVEYCSALIPLPYGVGNSSPQLFNILIKNCYMNLPTKLIEGNNQYDCVHISDVVKGIIAIANYGKNMKSYYIGHRIIRTFREIVTEIRNIVNPSARLLFGEYKDSLNMNYNLANVDDLYDDTGFECEAVLKETILETAQWLKEVGF